jgi:hypothetical protein
MRHYGSLWLFAVGLAGIGLGPVARAFAEPTNGGAREAAIEATVSYYAIRLQTLEALEAREAAGEPRAPPNPDTTLHSRRTAPE